MLDRPLMDWQKQVVSVAMELRPGTKIPAYREVIVTVPRQSGKTLLVLALEVHRCLRWGEPQRVVYTAQTGSDGRRALLNDQVPLIEKSQLRAAIKQVYRAAGSEGIIFRGGGSRIDVLASKQSSGHGRTVDLGVIDEAFDDADDHREQAIIPAMSTRASGQLFVISTAGHSGSAYLKRKIDAGRAAVTSGMTDTMAYFEWSCPEDMDIGNEDNWFSFMPALNNTIGIDAIRHARSSMAEGEFRRAYGNQWTDAQERVIPANVWEAVCSADVEPAGRLVFGIDVNEDRARASIAVADDEGRIELIENGEGVAWVVERVVDLANRNDADVVLDNYGPAANLAADIDLRIEGKVHEYATRDMSQACATFYDAVADGSVQIRSSSILDLAVAAATKRQTGDTWLWARRNAGTDISPLIAATIAFDKAAEPGGNVFFAYG